MNSQTLRLYSILRYPRPLGIIATAKIVSTSKLRSIALHFYLAAACCCNSIAWNLSMLCYKYVRDSATSPFPPRVLLIHTIAVKEAGPPSRVSTLVSMKCRVCNTILSTSCTCLRAAIGSYFNYRFSNAGTRQGYCGPGVNGSCVTISV